MATTIQTTAGEVRKACERTIAWASERHAAYAKERATWYAQVRERREREAYEEVVAHEKALDEWNRLPFWRRWNTPKPHFVSRKFAVTHLGCEDDALRMKYGISEVNRALRIARHWHAATNWLSPWAMVTLEVMDAIYLGYGVEDKTKEG